MTKEHEQRQTEDRKDLAYYLVNEGLGGKKFIASGIIARDGTFEFNHRKGVLKQGRDVYEVIEINKRKHLGVQEPFIQYYCGALVRTCRRELTFLANLNEHLYDVEATVEEVQQAVSNSGILPGNACIGNSLKRILEAFENDRRKIRNIRTN